MRPRSRGVVLATAVLAMACGGDDGGTDTAASASATQSGSASESGSSGSASATMTASTSASTSAADTTGSTTATTSGTADTGSSSAASSDSSGSSSMGSGSSDSGGACAMEQESCAHGELCCGALTCCGGVPVPPGAEYCGVECPDSDRNIKEGFAAIDADAVLAKVAALPVTSWSYKAEGPQVRHIGPMAQDFKAAFEVGASDKSIAKVDADGVALAAIQGVLHRVQDLERENAELRERLAQLERALGSERPTSVRDRSPRAAR